jgi:hypothetical protein
MLFHYYLGVTPGRAVIARMKQRGGSSGAGLGATVVEDRCTVGETRAAIGVPPPPRGLEPLQDRFRICERVQDWGAPRQGGHRQSPQVGDHFGNESRTGGSPTADELQTPSAHGGSCSLLQIRILSEYPDKRGYFNSLALTDSPFWRFGHSFASACVHHCQRTPLGVRGSGSGTLVPMAIFLGLSAVTLPESLHRRDRS